MCLFIFGGATSTKSEPIAGGLREAFDEVQVDRLGALFGVIVDDPDLVVVQIDGVHEFVHIVRLDAKRERVHIAKRLKQHALAFHDRHARLGADVAETQNRRAVGDDRAEVPAARQLVALV